MVDVPSLTAPEKGDHIIYWNGTTVIDPSVKEQKYTTLPETINEVYQLKFKREVKKVDFPQAVELLQQVNHTLICHNKVDANTPLHERIGNFLETIPAP
jgi:uncharacterized protein YpuA (DUF1002 family)